MVTRITASCLLLAFAVGCSGQQASTTTLLLIPLEQTPFQKAKVGDWVEFKTVTELGGDIVTVVHKQTVAGISGEEASIEIDVDGKKAKKTVRLDEKFPPRYIVGEADTFRGVEVGTEVLTVAGEKLKTHWVEVEALRKDMKRKFKVWYSEEIPVSGLVRLESKRGPDGSVMTVSRFGLGSR